MSDFIIYLIKANVALSLFYLVYRFFLAQLTFYKINRYYLLFSLVFAAICPSVQPWEWFSQGREISPGILTVIPDWQHLKVAEERLGASAFLETIFWIGASFFTLFLALKLTGLYRIHLESVPAHWKIFPYRKTNEKTGPFSFLKHMYFNPDFYKEDQYDKIFKHEQVHIQQLHSLDILLAEIALAFFWYNPICWLTRNSIRQNIEYLTDQKVLSSGIDKKIYQFSLLQISIFPPHPILGNHFNLKNLKKRMNMMNKKQSPKFYLGSYILIVPAVLFCSLIFGISHAYENSTIKNMLDIPTSSFQDTLKLKSSEHGPYQVIYADIFRIDKEKSSFDKKYKIQHADIQTIPVLKGSAKVPAYGKDSNRGVIEETIKKNSQDTIILRKEPLYIIDGEKQTSDNERNFNPKDIEAVNVLKDKAAISAYGEEGRYGVIEVTTKQNIEGSTLDPVLDNVLLFVDGKKMPNNDLSQLNPDDIKAMSVYKGEQAIQRFGEEGKNGVIEIVTHLENDLKIKVDTQLDLDHSVDIQVNTNINENENKESVSGTGSVEVKSKDASVDLSGEIGEDVLFLVDGIKIHHDELKNISPTDIKSVSVYKGVNAEEHFGKKGKEGVIEIFLKGDKPK